MVIALQGVTYLGEYVPEPNRTSSVEILSKPRNLGRLFCYLRMSCYLPKRQMIRRRILNLEELILWPRKCRNLHLWRL